MPYKSTRFIPNGYVLHYVEVVKYGSLWVAFDIWREKTCQKLRFFEILRQHTKTLIEAAQAGHSSAKDALVDRSRSELDHYIRLRAGALLRKTATIDDLSQEVFTKAFDSLNTFTWQGEESFSRWLKGIAENVILASAKKHRRNKLLLIDHFEASAHDPTPSGAERQKERFDRLKDALHRLDPDYREVIVLARLKGLCLKEVAERMNRSPNAVAHLLSRALSELKKLFGDTESFSLPAGRLDESTKKGQAHHEKE